MSGDEKIDASAETWPTQYWHALEDGRIQCDICPRECKLKEGQRGLCFVRGRLNDAVVLTTYGRSSGFCVDPIEKKPLNHFLPGTPTLSFGTAGCNLACKFCQNWDISKSREIDTLADGAKPEQVARIAQKLGCSSVAFTYNDPVIFMEHKRLYMTKCEVPKNLEPIPIGKGKKRKDGKDISIIAIQRMNLFALEAATELSKEGIECEIIDPRSYSPIDEEMILSSVKKTGKVIVVDESNPKCSLASEISSLISEKEFSSLKAPIYKLTAPHTPVPFSPPMEDFYIPKSTFLK